MNICLYGHCGKLLEPNDETITKFDFPRLAYEYLFVKDILRNLDLKYLISVRHKLKQCKSINTNLENLTAYFYMFKWCQRSLTNFAEGIKPECDFLIDEPTQYSHI